MSSILPHAFTVFADLSFRLEEESKAVFAERKLLKERNDEVDHLRRQLQQEKEKLEVVKLSVRRETARSFERQLASQERELENLVNELVDESAEGGGRNAKKTIKLVKSAQGTLQTIKTGVKSAVNSNFFESVENDLTANSTPLDSLELVPSYVKRGFELVCTNQNTPLYNNLVEFESFESNEKFVNILSLGMSFRLKKKGELRVPTQLSRNSFHRFRKVATDVIFFFSFASLSSWSRPRYSQ